MTRLGCYLNLLTLAALPEASAAPRTRDPRPLLEALAAAGYDGVQGFEFAIAGVPAADPGLCAALGLGCVAQGLRVERVGTIGADAARWADQGFESATVHVGFGHESDDEVRALLDDVVTASDRHGIPLYVETHRGTVTQDTWRTVRMVGEHPELRFNGDFSHWYTGLEMTYGDFDARLAFLAPVFERTRFLHGRIGESGAIQIDVGEGDAAVHPSVAHFEQFWTAAFRGFLAHAEPSERIVFAPELLPAAIGYARTVPDAAGRRVEEGDRWQQALVLTDIARRCYAAAEDLHAAVAAGAVDTVGVPA